MREIVSPLDGFASPFGPQRGFNPLRIFANDEPGVWFEANDANTLFTDVAGTTPVTAPGDAVALQLDKSQGLTLGPELVTQPLDVAQFTDGGDITFTQVGSSVHMTRGSGGIGGSVNLNAIPGKFYEISFTTRLISGVGPNRIFINTNGTIQTLTDNNGSTNLFVLGSADLSIWTDKDTTIAIDNISVRELPGNHRTQATTAARPLYALHPVGGVRNLLQYTEEFDNAVWQKFNLTLTSNTTVAPDGSSTADKIVADNAAVSQINYTTSDLLADDTDYWFFTHAKADEWSHLELQTRRQNNTVNKSTWFNLSTGAVGTTNHADATITDVGDGWYLCAVKANIGTGSATPRVYIVPTNADNTSSLGDGTSGIFIWGAQLEQSSTATNYQRVGSFLDVSEEGKARRGRLWYNGTSHFMQTPTITPGTDKVQVFAGVRKLSDAAIAQLAEFATLFGADSGVFYLAAPRISSAPSYGFNSKGTAVGQTLVSNSAYTAPVSNVITGLGDISGDSAILRVDGVQEDISTDDQGTGNYLAYPLYFGARAGTSLFFNGYEDTSIIRFGPNLDASVIGKVESYVASKTPEATI